MAFPATNIPNRSGGEFIDDADWDELVDALNFLANKPACRATRSAAKSIPNASETIIDFDSETGGYDTDSMHTTGGSNTRITINTAGLYLVTFTGQLAAASTYDRIRAFIRLGGATNIGGAQAAKTTGSIAPELDISLVYKFAVTNYIEVDLFQDGTGSAQNLSSPVFTATWLCRG